MSKCVTSEHCCEISNLIHEEVVVVVERWSGDGLLQAAFRKNPWLLKKLSLAAERERRRTHIEQTRTGCIGATSKTSKRQR